MRIKKIFLISILLSLVQMHTANGWELSVPGEDETLVRTYFNPAFGPFDVFIPAANYKRSWDIQNYGVFYLNVYCSGSKYLVLTRFQKWNDEESMWKSVPFEKSPSLSMKFGKSNAISWGTRLQEDIDGAVITNSNLFLKKIKSVKTLSFPVLADGTKYQVKFNTAGFSKFIPDLEDAGC